MNEVFYLNPKFPWFFGEKTTWMFPPRKFTTYRIESRFQQQEKTCVHYINLSDFIKIWEFYKFLVDFQS